MVVATVQASALTPLTVVGERLIYSSAAGTWGYALGEAPALLIESEAYYAKTGSAGAVVYTVDGIFGTDGTAQGTELLLEGNLFWSGAVFGGRVLFGDNSDGIETWASDGTLAGTELLFTGPAVETSTEMNGALYFRTTSPTHELWVSDGTQAGTSVVYQLGGDPAGSQQDMATLADDLLVMTDADGLVWTSDGTELGTVAVGAPPSIAGGDEQLMGDGAFVVADGVALFTGIAAGTDAVWRTDGTLAGTYELLHNAWIQPFIPFAGDIYFAHINQLWRSDGTVPGTVETGISTEGLLGPAGGRLFYWSAGNVWSTDGTVEGAREVFAFAEFQGLPGLVAAGPDSIWWSFQGLGEQLLAGCRVPQ